MSIKTSLAIVGLGAALAIASAGGALAAVSSHGAPVYSRPSSNSHIVNHLYRNERVRIEAVSRGWCEVRIPGPDGWVRCSALGNYPMSHFRPGITFNFGFPFPFVAPHYGSHMGWWWNGQTNSWWDSNKDSHGQDYKKHP